MSNETPWTGRISPRSVLKASCRSFTWSSGVIGVGSSSSSRVGVSLLDASEFGVERVAEGLADEVVGVDGEEDHKAGEEREPPFEGPAGRTGDLVEELPPGGLVDEAEAE